MKPTRCLSDSPFRRARLLALCWAVLGSGEAGAVMFLDTDATGFNTTTPGDNSGWQYEGKFLTFLGVPIGPHFFITAKHFGGSIGNTFDFHGEIYTTIGFHDVPGTDLRIWEVNHSKPFPNYAPLSSGAADIGATATIFGRGTRRGDPVLVSSQHKGWKWGPGDDVKRWGRNVVEGAVMHPTYGELLYCDFNSPGIPHECHLSVGDSGGGLFVLEDGLWRLAGIHLAVDGPFRIPPSTTEFNGALFDQGGLEYKNGNTWVVVPDQAEDVPSAFYSSRISASLPWISNLVPQVGSLAPENYETWLPLYFSPTQIATSLTGRLSDFDKDGISNLLEFALNLDPSFNETEVMIAGTGLRGLPLVRIEPDGPDEKLTIEYVRRTVGSGAALDYLPEFSSDLVTWNPGSAPVVEPINARWERVKVSDTVAKSASARRSARLKVIETP